MKEEKTKSKKKILYYVALTISVLLLIAATVLTVYFVTGDRNEMIDNPPPVVDPNEPNEPENPDTPTGGETVSFVVPVDYSGATHFNEIYVSPTMGWIYRHKAVDFAAEEGASVCAIADGTVEQISMNDKTGNYIVISHGEGLKSLYRFVEPVTGLREGASVKKGDSIATVAAAYGSESKDGPHLHFEIELNGKEVDPADYIDFTADEK